MCDYICPTCGCRVDKPQFLTNTFAEDKTELNQLKEEIEYMRNRIEEILEKLT